MEEKEQCNNNPTLNVVDLMRFRQCGIYCIRNDDEKYVQVFGSKNMLEHLSNLIKNVDGGEYGILKNQLNLVVIEILEICGDDLKVCLSKWIDIYKKNNYKFYKETNLVNYKIKDDIGIINNKQYILVYLENRRKDKIVVGVFDTILDANEFKNEFYPNDIISGLVYCENKYRSLCQL